MYYCVILYKMSDISNVLSQCYDKESGLFSNTNEIILKGANHFFLLMTSCGSFDVLNFKIN